MKRSNLDLLKDPRVKEEIERYRWIESATAGYEISDELATYEWLSLYADNWQKAMQLSKETIGGQEHRNNECRQPRIAKTHLNVVFA